MKRNDLYQFIKGNLNGPNDPTAQQKLCQFVSSDASSDANLQKEISRFLSKLRDKWNQCSRVMEVFENKYSSWLENEFVLPSSLLNTTPDDKQIKSGGRPKCDFEEASDRSKRRKAQQIRVFHSPDELLHATVMSLRAEGRSVEAKVVHSLAHDNNQKPYTADEALALLLDASLTKASYQLLRSQAIEKGYNLYPSYNSLREAKLRCYPEHIQVDDFKAEITVQSLVDHTSKRLCESQMLILQQNPNIDRLMLTYKWGFDGATSQSIYKQISEVVMDRDLKQEEHLFITCMVPLELCSGSQVIWRNPKPSSTLFCRPIRFQFIKESQQAIKDEESYIGSQIAALFDTVVKVEGDDNRSVQVHHILQLTMIDGKIHNALSDVTNSTQCCSVCGVSPHNMNDLQAVTKITDFPASGLQYGLSTLHAWIRFFECLLHISYRLPFKKWQARGEENQQTLQKEKLRVQTEFKNRMGLVVDRPKEGGSGTSNDGNTARRAFQNADLTANILKLNKELVEKFHIILITLSSGYDIDSLRFKDFCLETAQIFVQNYPWFYMPSSVHKILLHGYLVIEHMALPIGMMSEEALESRNKDFKKYREHFTRKSSRQNTNADLINRLLASSDPRISSSRKVKSKYSKVLPAQVLQLLKPLNPLQLQFKESIL